MSQGPISAKERTAPVSLVEGATAADRRHLAAVAAANGAPSGIVGVATFEASHIHLMVELLGAAETLDYSLWLYDRTSEKWYLDTRLGTDGVVSLVETDADHPQGTIVEIAGVDRVYVELAAGTALGGAGVNVWVSGNTYV